MTDEVHSNTPEDVPTGIAAWFWSIGEWRAWVHTIYAGAVGAVGSPVLLYLGVGAAFGGIPVAIGLGIIVLVVFAGLFGLGAYLHPVGRRGPVAVWLAVSAILWLACMVGTFVVSSQASINAQHPSEWLGVAIGGITAAGAALVTWPGVGRVIAFAGVVAGLVFIEPWPVTPTYSGEDQSGQIKVVPYMAQLPEYPYLGDPEPAYGDAILWHFRDGSAAAEDPVSFTVITEDGAPEACRGDLYALIPLPASDAELTCEAVSIDGLDGAILRTGTIAHELTTVIDGTRVRVVADASVPESLLADALRSAVPMPQQMYEAWIVTRERMDRLAADVSTTRPPITGYRRSTVPGTLLDVLSFDQFRAVIASPPHRAQYGLEVSPATLAMLGTDENTAQSFYSDWTRDGQPRLSALPAQAMPAYAPPAAVAVQPTYAAPAAAAAPQPSYAPAVPQFSRDPHSAPSSAPTPYRPMSGSAAPQQMPYPTQTQAQAPNSGMRNILVGFGVAIVGTIITVATYNASGPGGTFVVAWGAIIFGSIQGIRGIVQLLKG